MVFIDKMNRLLNIILKISDIISLCFLVPLLAGSLFAYRTLDFDTFRESTSEIRENPFVNVFLLLLILGICWLIIRLYRIGSGIDKWGFAYITMGVCAFIMLTAGHSWIQNNPFLPQADQAEVWNAANAISSGKTMDESRLLYFQEYPQQKPMAVIMSIFVSLVGGDLKLYSHINLFFMVLTVIMTALCLKELTNRQDMVALVTVMLTTFVPLVFYSKFIYGSVIAIGLTVISAYDMIQYFKGKSVFYLILPVIFVPLSVMLYQSELIFLIAVVIVMVTGAFMHREKVERWYVCLIAVVFLIIGTALLTYGTDSVFEEKLGSVQEGGNGIPATGHILMGLEDIDGNMPGNYNGSSQRLYEELGYDSDEADRQSRQRIIENINLFLQGERSWTFFLIKTECQWLDPWFGGVTMNVCDAEYRGAYDDEAWDAFLNSGIMPILQKYLHLLMMLVYAGAAAGILIRLRRGEVVNAVAYLPGIYFTGGFIFQFIWEQKSRYCLPYYIALFPIAAYGICNMTAGCEREFRGWNTRKRVYVTVGVLGTLILLMLTAFDMERDFKPNISFDEAGGIYRTGDMQLPKGDYGIVLGYEASEDKEIQLCLDNSGVSYPVYLSREEYENETPAYMDSYKDNVHFIYDHEAAAGLELKNIHVYSTRLMYLDHFFFAIIYLVTVIYMYHSFEPESYVVRPFWEKLWLILLPMTILTAALASYLISRYMRFSIICKMLRVSAGFSIFTVLLFICVVVWIGVCLGIRYSAKREN
ncbi:MAG: hypothetical protein IJV16_02925 [Lachnospiraceae bacterium]|nr:hypothetical protein [Lachnospiraceae bacterium]